MDRLIDGLRTCSPSPLQEMLGPCWCIESVHGNHLHGNGKPQATPFPSSHRNLSSSLIFSPNHFHGNTKFTMPLNINWASFITPACRSTGTGSGGTLSTHQRAAISVAAPGLGSAASLSIPDTSSWWRTYQPDT